MCLPIKSSRRLLYGYLWEQVAVALQRALLGPQHSPMAGQAQKMLIILLFPQFLALFF